MPECLNFMHTFLKVTFFGSEKSGKMFIVAKSAITLGLVSS